MRIARLLLVLAGLFGLIAVGASMAAAATDGASVEMVAFGGDVTEGAAIYLASCSTCHQSDGSGIVGSFPPLAGNPRAADTDYVEGVVRDGLTGPIEVLGVTYNAAMPATTLSNAEIEAVAGYVASIAEADVTPPTTVAPGPIEGDAALGERLFAGKASFEHGGAACHACHSAGSIGFRGGSGLGPDLTDVFTRFGGEPGLTAWLTSPASPTMEPLFAERELTEGEIADLVSFFATAESQPAAGGVDQMLLGGIAGLALLIGLMALLITGPRETYTQRLRRRHE